MKIKDLNVKVKEDIVEVVFDYGSTMNLQALRDPIRLEAYFPLDLENIVTMDLRVIEMVQAIARFCEDGEIAIDYGSLSKEVGFYLCIEEPLKFIKAVQNQGVPVPKGTDTKPDLELIDTLLGNGGYE